MPDIIDEVAGVFDIVTVEVISSFVCSFSAAVLYLVSLVSDVDDMLGCIIAKDVSSLVVDGTFLFVDDVFIDVEIPDDIDPGTLNVNSFVGDDIDTNASEESGAIAADAEEVDIDLIGIEVLCVKRSEIDTVEVVIMAEFEVVCVTEGVSEERAQCAADVEAADLEKVDVVCFSLDICEVRISLVDTDVFEDVILEATSIFSTDSEELNLDIAGLNVNGL